MQWLVISCCRGQIRALNTIPSIKLDHSLNTKTKLSFFYSSTNTKSDKQTANNYEGYPDTITAGRTNSVRSKTWRLNLDKTITPTLLFHLGAGYQTYWFGAIEEAQYDAAKELGLKGVPYNRLFPSLTGMATALGGAENMGTTSSSINRYLKPSATASLSWVRNNHSYRFGGEVRTEGYFRETYTATAGAYAFSAQPDRSTLYCRTESGRRKRRFFLRQLFARAGKFSDCRTAGVPTRWPPYNWRLRSGFVEGHAKADVGLRFEIRLPKLPQRTVRSGSKLFSRRSQCSVWKPTWYSSV